MNKEEIKNKYIEFRCDVMNDCFEDSVFCTENGVSIDQLNDVKDPEVLRTIRARPIKEETFFKLLEQLTRLCYDKALNGSIPVKSLEGLVNAISQLLKQRNLSNGKPTEIVKYEDLEDKTPQQLHAMLMGSIRNARLN